MSCWMSSSRVHTTLTGPSTCWAICDRAVHAVDLEPAAEAAAEQMVVHARPCRAAGRSTLAATRLGAGQRPGCRPRPRSRPCARARCSSSAPSWHAPGTAPGSSPRPWWPRRPCALAVSPVSSATAPCLSVACSSSRATSAVVSLACGPSSHSILSAASPFFAAPIWSATTATAVVELHDLAHALDGLGGRVVDALQLTTEHRRLRQRGDLHAGRTRVDAIDRRAVDLGRRVEPLGRRADQLEVLRILERHLLAGPAARRRRPPARRTSGCAPSADAALRPPARGTTPDRRSSAWPPRRPAACARPRRPRAAASTTP